MKKLYKISAILTKDGFRWIETEWDCKYGKKVYVATRLDADGEKIERRLPKEQLNEIKSVFIQPSHIEYHCITTIENIESVKDRLFTRICITIDVIEKELNQLKAAKHIMV